MNHEECLVCMLLKGESIEMVKKGEWLVCPVCGNRQRRPPKRPWPDLPNGEGVVGLTESEVLQGREPPKGCDPVDSSEGQELPNDEGIEHETVGQRTERAILDVIAPTGPTESEVLQILCACGHLKVNHHEQGWCLECECERVTDHA